MSELLDKFFERGKRLAEVQSFVPKEFLENVYELPNAELNSQDFGIIKLEDSGKILFYNTYESELANISPKTAEGKNFFFEIAPCTNNRLFLGSFQKGIEIGENKMLFFYTFTYRMKPTNVKVMIFRKSGAKENWVFIKKNFT